MPKTEIMSKTRKILVPIVLILGLIEFIPHEHPTASADASAAFTTDNAELKSILDKACMDCHSNETKYPWYAEVTPINMWIDGHIEEGREHLNFSEWNSASAADRSHMSEEIVEVVHEKEMPMLFYWLIHWDAKLTDAERKVIVDAFGGLETNASHSEEGDDDDDDH
jgi:hypothetical protein